VVLNEGGKEAIAQGEETDYYEGEE
jgi:hypothetical protein